MANFFVAVFTKVYGSGSKTGFAQVLLRCYCVSGIVVTQGDYSYTGNVGETVYSTGSAHAEAYECDTYGFQFRSGESEDMFLTGRAFRSFHNEGAFVPVGFGGW